MLKGPEHDSDAEEEKHQELQNPDRLGRVSTTAVIIRTRDAQDPRPDIHGIGTRTVIKLSANNKTYAGEPSKSPPLRGGHTMPGGEVGLRGGAATQAGRSTTKVKPKSTGAHTRQAKYHDFMAAPDPNAWQRAWPGRSRAQRAELVYLLSRPPVKGYPNPNFPLPPRMWLPAKLADKVKGLSAVQRASMETVAASISNLDQEEETGKLKRQSSHACVDSEPPEAKPTRAPRHSSHGRLERVFAQTDLDAEVSDTTHPELTIGRNATVGGRPEQQVPTPIPLLDVPISATKKVSFSDHSLIDQQPQVTPPRGGAALRPRAPDSPQPGPRRRTPRHGRSLLGRETSVARVPSADGVKGGPVAHEPIPEGGAKILRRWRRTAATRAKGPSTPAGTSTANQHKPGSALRLLGNAGSQHSINSDDSGKKPRKTSTRKTMLSKSRKKMSSGRTRSLAYSADSQKERQTRFSVPTPPVRNSSEGGVSDCILEHGGSGENRTKAESTNLGTEVWPCELHKIHLNHEEARAGEHEQNSRARWGVLGSASDILARAQKHSKRRSSKQTTSSSKSEEVEKRYPVNQPQTPHRHSSESMPGLPIPNVQSSPAFAQHSSGVYAIPALGRLVPFSNNPQDSAKESSSRLTSKDKAEAGRGIGDSDALDPDSDPSSRSSAVNHQWPGLEKIQTLSKPWQYSETVEPEKIPSNKETGEVETRFDDRLSRRRARNSELLVESEWWQATPPPSKINTNQEGAMRTQSGRTPSSDTGNGDERGRVTAGKKQRRRSGVDLGPHKPHVEAANGKAQEDCEAEDSPAESKSGRRHDIRKNLFHSEDKLGRASEHSVSKEPTNALLGYPWLEEDASSKPGRVANDASTSHINNGAAKKLRSGKSARSKKSRRRVGFKAAVESAMLRTKDSKAATLSADSTRSTSFPLLEIPPFRSRDVGGVDKETLPALAGKKPDTAASTVDAPDATPALKLPSVRRHLIAHHTSFPDTGSGTKSRFHSSRSMSVMVSVDQRWPDKPSGEAFPVMVAGANLSVPESAEPDPASPARPAGRSARRRDDLEDVPPVGKLPAKQMLSKNAYCDVRGPGNGKWEAVVGTPTRFCLLTHDTRGGRPVRAQDFTVWFKSGECVPQATLSYIDTNVFGVDWLATAVGQMGINVLIDNRPVIGAPFFVDVQPVIPTPQYSYVVGEDITTPVAGEKNTLEVLVCDQFANLCGRGGTQLLVSIEGPDNIDNIVIHDKDNGTYSVTYTLRKAGDYTLSLQLATEIENEHIHGSPYYLCARPGPYYFLKTRVHPSSLETECGVDLVMFFSLRDKNMNPCTTGASGPIQVTIVRKKDEAQMDVAVVDCQDGSYRVDYSAPLSGEYSLQIIHNGVRRFDPPKTITVHGGKSVPSMSYIIGPDRDSTSKVQGAVGEKRIFFVQLVDIHGNKKSDDKPEKVAAMIEYKEESDGSLHALEANMIDVEPAPNGQYQVSWQGRKIGSYFIHVKLDGQPVSGSPFKAEMTRGQVCIEQCEVVMESDRSMAPIAGERAQFRVQAKDMYSNNVRIGGVEFQLVFELDDKELSVRKKIDPLIDSDLTVESVVDNRDGTYSFAYTALKADTMQMHVVTKANGRSILGSPFLVSVSAAHVHIPSSTITLEDTQVVAGRFCSVEILALDMFGNLQVSGIEAFTVTMELCEDCAAATSVLPVLPDTCSSLPCKTSSIRRTVVLDPNQNKPREPTSKAPTAGKWSSIARPSPRMTRVASSLIQADPSGLELHIKYEGRGKYCMKYKASVAGPYRFTVASTKEANSDLCKTFEVTVLPASIQAHNCKLEYVQGHSIAGEPCTMTLYAHDQFGNRIYKGGAEVKWTVQNEMLANSKNMRRLKLQMKAKQIHANRSAKSQLGWGGGVAALAEELVMQMEEDADDEESSEDEAHQEKDSDNNPKAEQSPSAKAMTIGTMCRIASAVGILQRTRSDLSLPVFLKSITKDNKDGTYQMETRAKRSGSYLVSFSVNGEVHPKQTQVHVSAGPVDISRCTLLGAGLEDGTAGVISRFTIKAKDRYSNQVETGGETFSVFLKPDKHKDRQTISFVRGRVVDNGDGTYSAEFLPVLAGRHVLLVSHVKSRQTFYKDVVSIKPADPDPATCEVAGHSLHQAVLGCTAQLSLVVRDKFGNLCSMGDDKQTRLACIVEGPSGVIDALNHSNVYEAPDCHAGIYLFTYTPHETGPCQLQITVDRRHVNGSPFPLKVVEGLVDVSEFARKIDNIQQHMGTSLASGWDRMWLPESGQQYETEEMDARLGVPSYLRNRPWNPTTAHLLSISGPRIAQRAAQSIEDREKALAKYERYLVRKRVTIMHAGICSLLPSAEEVKQSPRESTSGEQAMVPHMSDPIPPAEAYSSLSKSPRSARRHVQVFDPEKYLQLIAKR